MIAYAIPMRQRGMFLSLTACMTGIASIAGPLLGGIFTDRLSWRWCFWINLPFGGIAVLIVFFFFKNPARDYDHLSLIEKIQKVDLPGAFFLITSIICLLLALQWGGMSSIESRDEVSSLTYLRTDLRMEKLKSLGLSPGIRPTLHRFHGPPNPSR